MESNPFVFNKKKFGENSKFRSNVDIPKCPLNNFLFSNKFPTFRFYKEILIWWGKYLPFPVSLPSTITSQFLWFSKYINVNRRCICFRWFSKKGLNFLGQLFDLEGKLKKWTAIKNEYHLLESKMQLVDTLETSWK